MFKVNDKVLCYHGPFLYEATVRLSSSHGVCQSTDP